MKSTVLAACVGMLLAIAPALAQNAPPGNPTNTGFMAQQSLRRSVRSAVTPERRDTVGPAWVSERRHPRRRPSCSPRQALSSRLQAASLPAGSPLPLVPPGGRGLRLRPACAHQRLPDVPPSG